METFTPDSYVWASEALRDITEGRAKGNRLALIIRARLQLALFRLGSAAHKHCGKVVLLGIVIMCVFGIGLTRIHMETNAEKLWVEVGGRLQHEMAYSKAALGEEAGASQELLIETPRIKGSNILTTEALLLHLKALKKATKVTVNVKDREWTLKDLCYAPNLPQTENKFLRLVYNLLLPCAIITPLDCFWEGAKIHGPEKNITFQSQHLKWTSLNPLGLLETMKLLPSGSRDVKTIRAMYKEAGITTGYIEKPCIDPTDPECPRSAPNYRSKKKPDIGVELTDGCHGFAAKYMEWPEELIVGGVKKNRSGTIRSAAALQSVIYLMGAQNMQRYHQDSDGIDLSLESAKAILQAWQRNFTQVMNSENSPRNQEYNILAFTSTSFNDLLRDFSKSSVVRLAIGYVLMVVYACLTLKRWTDAVNSHGGLGVAGVILVTLSVAAGLGFSSFVGISFNAASTQVLPFLALGLGVDDMFLIAHTYAALNDIHPSDKVGYSLGCSGVSVLLTSFNNMFAFFMAAMIPIPALRAFSLQAAVIVVFNFFAVIIVFPAMIAIDVNRKTDQRYDVICCMAKTTPQRISLTPDSSTDTGMVLRRYNNSSCSSLSSENSTITSPPGVGPQGLGAVVSANGTIDLPGTVTVRASAIAELGPTNVYNTMLPLSVSNLVTTSRQEGQFKGSFPSSQRRNAGNAVCDIDLGIASQTTERTRNFKPHHSSSSVVICSSTNGVNIRDVNHNSRGSGSKSTERKSRMNDGRRPRDNWRRFKEHLSLAYFARHYYGPWLQKNSTKIFVLFMFAAMFGVGAYGCKLVRDGLDLTDVVPRNSSEHQFVAAQSQYFSFYLMYAVTKNDFDYPDGQKLLYKYHEALSRISNVVKTPDMKAQPFWLIYFRDWLKDMQKAFDDDWSSNCITFAGWRENASDSGVIGYKMLAQTGDNNNPINKTQVRSVRLVDQAGIIRPQTFYNYLTAWINVDTMGYDASQANIKPDAVNWFNLRDVREPHSMRMEANKPIEFAQLPFYLFNLRETEDFIETIKEVRKICDEFHTVGLPSYPSGIPFTFWEQYIWLRQHLLLAIIVILAVSFLVMATLLCSVWMAIFIVLTLMMITVQVFGFMGLANIKLSAVPAVTLILSVGVGVEFTVHMCLAFQTATGDRNQRMQKAIEHVFTPIVDGAVSTLLGVVMLAGSDFDFIVRYFFHLLASLIVVGTLNGLMFLPVLLSLAGPSPEVEEIRPPGTSSSAGSQRELLPSTSCRRTPHTDSQLCILDTGQVPDDRVEESTCHSQQRASKKHRKTRHNRVHRAHKISTPPRMVDSDSSSSTVTRVTATATVTVEVHTEQFASDRTVLGRVVENSQHGSRRARPMRDSGQPDRAEIEIIDLEQSGIR